MGLWDSLFKKRRNPAPAGHELTAAPQSPVPPAKLNAVAAPPVAPRRSLQGSTNWRVSLIERSRLDNYAEAGVFAVAGGATATWQATGEPPASVDADITVKCPACERAFLVRLTRILTENLDNAQRLSEAPCPACGRCTVLIRGLVRSSESPMAIHLIATIHSAEASLVPVDPSVEIVAVTDGPARTSLPGLNDVSSHPEVVFVKKDVVDLMGRVCTYHVYEAPTKAAALAFLEGQIVEKEYVYITVNTPEGSCTRDKTGIRKK